MCLATAALNSQVSSNAFKKEKITITEMRGRVDITQSDTVAKSERRPPFCALSPDSGSRSVTVKVTHTSPPLARTQSPAFFLMKTRLLFFLMKCQILLEMVGALCIFFYFLARRLWLRLSKKSKKKGVQKIPREWRCVSGDRSSSKKGQQRASGVLDCLNWTAHCKSIAHQFETQLQCCTCAPSLLNSPSLRHSIACLSPPSSVASHLQAHHIPSATIPTPAAVI